MFGPLIRISPSSAIFSSTPGSGAPDGAEAVVLDRRDGRRGGGLGHPVALEHRHARRPRRTRGSLWRSAPRRWSRGARCPPKIARTFLNSCSSASSKGFCSSAGSASPRDASCRAPSRRARSPPARAACSSGGLRLDRAVRERVDLLEHARHRRQVGRFDLHQLAARSAWCRRRSRRACRRGRRRRAGSAARRSARAAGTGR